MRSLHLLTALITTFLSLIQAKKVAELPYCFSSCLWSVDRVNFGLKGLNIYSAVKCNSTVFVASLLLCTDDHCSTAEADEGWGAAADTCLTWAETPIVPLADARAAIPPTGEIPTINPEEKQDGVASSPVRIDDAYWKTWYRTLATRDRQLRLNMEYSYLLWLAAALVTLAGLLRRALLRARIRPPAWLRHHLLVPALMGTTHSAPLNAWVTVPTRLQSLLVLAYIALNLGLSSASFTLFPENRFWPGPEGVQQQFWRYFPDRTGVLAFANLPLVVLLGGRNCFLIALTGWSFTTMNVFHRWTGRVCLLQTVAHSIAYSIYVLYVKGWTGYINVWARAYWWQGAVATVAFSILVALSSLPLRQRVYEFFVVSHIVLTVVSIFFCYRHIELFPGPWNWFLHLSLLAWAVDRGWRVVTVVRVNLLPFPASHNAVCEYLPDADILKLTVTITTPRPAILPPGLFYYAYLPLTTTFYESHPFTVAWQEPSLPSSPTLALLPSTNSVTHSASNSDSSSEDSALLSPAGPSPSPSTLSSSSPTSDRTNKRINLTFLLRPRSGMTLRLKNTLLASCPLTRTPLPLPLHTTILLEGPYGQSHDLRAYARILLIAGGIGAAATVPYLLALTNPSNSPSRPQEITFILLVRTPSLLPPILEHPAVTAALRQPHCCARIFVTGGGADTNCADTDGLAPVDGEDERKYTASRGRPDVRELIQEEASAEGGRGRTAVLSCGPAGLVDEVRAAVVECTGAGLEVDYFEEAFGW